MAALITCPSCRKSLQVPDELLGQRAQCPECKHVFATEAPPAPVELGGTSTFPPPPPPPPSPPVPPPPPVSTAPSKPPVWEKPDPLEKRRRRRDEDDDDEDDDDDDRPRRRRRRRRSSSGGGGYGPPHRGGLILALGILSFFIPLFGLVMGATVWSMANNDLRAMREGNMDPSGEGPTRVGQVFAIIATLLWMIPCLIFCSLGAFTGAFRRF